jgi:phage protein D
MTTISYTLLIDSLPADASLLEAIQEIEVEEHINLAAMLRLRFAVGMSQDGSGWQIIDDDTFSRLKPISLLMTVGTGLPETLIDAYVIETKADFSNEPGQSTFEVVAMDATVLMNLEEKVRAWPDMADGDIAETIFGEHGFMSDVDSTQLVRQERDLTTMQRGTDIQFLRRLARRNGFECYVETNSLTMLTEGHFHAPRLDESPSGTLTVNMGAETNVDNLNARYDMLRPTTVDVAGVAIGSQDDQNATIDAPSHSQLGQDSALDADQQRVRLLNDTGLAETGELQSYAQAVVDESAWAISAQGELDTATFGLILRTRRPVLVRGAGQHFSGTYYVERVQHLISGDNFKQHFTLRRNATGLEGIELFGLI